MGAPEGYNRSSYTSTNLVKNPVISDDGIVTTANGTYPWSSLTHVFRNGLPSDAGNRTMYELVTST